MQAEAGRTGIQAASKLFRGLIIACAGRTAGTPQQTFWSGGNRYSFPSSIAFTGQCLLDAEFLSWLQIEGVPFDFPDNVLPHNLSLEAAQSVLHGLARDAALRAYLRNRGAHWLVAAFAQFILAAYLSAAWGVVCLALGALNLAFPRRGMLITNGAALVVVGVSNVCATLYVGKPGLMTYIGVMQVIWGVKDLGRYGAAM